MCVCVCVCVVTCMHSVRLAHPNQLTERHPGRTRDKETQKKGVGVWDARCGGVHCRGCKVVLYQAVVGRHGGGLCVVGCVGCGWCWRVGRVGLPNNWLRGTLPKRGLHITCATRCLACLCRLGCLRHVASSCPVIPTPRPWTHQKANNVNKQIT